jgi:hypothetical protein
MIAVVFAEETPVSRLFAAALAMSATAAQLANLSVSRQPRFRE